MRHEQQRAGKIRAGDPRATGSRRCRDGSSARRGAADPDPRRAPSPSSVRRRHPPDSSRIGRSAGSDSRDRTISTFCSSRHPSRSSSWCCSSPSRSSATASSGLGDTHRGAVVLGDDRPERAKPGRHFVEDDPVARRPALPARAARSAGRARARRRRRPEAYPPPRPSTGSTSPRRSGRSARCARRPRREDRPPRKAADGRKPGTRNRGSEEALGMTDWRLLYAQGREAE